MTFTPEAGTEFKPLIGGLIQIRKLEPIYPEAASLRNAVYGVRFEKDNQEIPDGVPRQLNQVSTASLFALLISITTTVHESLINVSPFTEVAEAKNRPLRIAGMSALNTDFQLPLDEACQAAASTRVRIPWILWTWMMIDASRLERESRKLFNLPSGLL